MRILISGSHGFVGRAFCKHFLDRNHKVVGIDNMAAGKPHEEWMFQPNDKKNFAQLFCDLRGFMNNRPSREWGSQSFDLIIHCAAVVGGRLKIENDPLAVGIDLAIDSEFFNWVVRTKPMPKVIYFSSSAIYPLTMQWQSHHVPLREAAVHFYHATEQYRGSFELPDLTYGFAKFAGEYLAKFAVEKYGLDCKIYRPFGGYGEDQDLTYPFPSIIKRVVDGHDPVLVWGSGDQRRDFIHIDDVVDAVVATMDKLPAGEPLNLGTGIGTSFFELAELAVQLAGKDVSVRNDPLKPEGVFCRVADVTKMKQYYQPKITLAEGIQRALKAIKPMEKIGG